MPKNMSMLSRAVLVATVIAAAAAQNKAQKGAKVAKGGASGAGDANPIARTILSGSDVNAVHAAAQVVSVSDRQASGLCRVGYHVKSVPQLNSQQFIVGYTYECARCPEGYWSAGDGNPSAGGKTECDLCAENFKPTGSGDCESCAGWQLGTYLPAGYSRFDRAYPEEDGHLTDCQPKPCEADHFSPAAGKECEPCPPGTTLDAGASNTAQADNMLNLDWQADTFGTEFSFTTCAEDGEAGARQYCLEDEFVAFVPAGQQLTKLDGAPLTMALVILPHQSVLATAQTIMYPGPGTSPPLMAAPVASCSPCWNGSYAAIGAKLSTLYPMNWPYYGNDRSDPGPYVYYRHQYRHLPEGRKGLAERTQCVFGDFDRSGYADATEPDHPASHEFVVTVQTQKVANAAALKGTTTSSTTSGGGIVAGITGAAIIAGLAFQARGRRRTAAEKAEKQDASTTEQKKAAPRTPTTTAAAKPDDAPKTPGGRGMRQRSPGKFVAGSSSPYGSF